jgi:hypothetical protein
MKTSTFRKTILLFSILCLASACDDDDDFDDFDDLVDEDDIDDIVDEDGLVDTDDLSVAYDSADVAGMYAATDSIDNGLYGEAAFLTDADGNAQPNDPEAVAAAVEGSITEYFSPPGCASSELADATVTVSMSSCEGPFGLSVIDGTLIAEFSTNDEDDLAIDLSSEDLLVDDVATTIEASGVYSRDEDGTKRVSFMSNRAFSRGDDTVVRNVMGDITWSAGSQCVTVDASGELTKAAETFSVDVADFQQCVGSCPTQGDITVTGENDVTASFDGSDTLSYQREDGTNGEIALECEPVN